MGAKKFSPDVLAELRKNPCVGRIINDYQVEFTPEFKELACQELLKGKKTMREILRDHGVDPKILGDYRIWQISRTLREKIKNGCQPEQVNIMKRSELCNNPYVSSVKSDKVYFTKEFKDLVCQELLKGGKNMSNKRIREVLEHFGFDTQVLGEARVARFSCRIRERCIQLRENHQNLENLANVSDCYNVSQKEREDITNGMDTNGSSHEERMEFLKKPQLPDAEVFETEVEANNISETNQDTGILQKVFTEEERSALLNNPYVASVTNDAVQFTEEFKELAYQEILQTKKTMREILQEHGIDPEILGSKRIWNFTSKLQEKAKKLQGFGDARTHNRRRPKCNPTEEKTLTERIRGLEHELAYTRQEVEFLKKTQMVDMEARISWESKHRKK